MPVTTSAMPRLAEPAPIRPQDLPGLARITWDIHLEELKPEEAFALYEARWHYLDPGQLPLAERDLIRRLIAEHGGRFLGRGFHAGQL
jgi:hypothetical protein